MPGASLKTLLIWLISRRLKIALGSNTERYSHLTVLRKLDFLPTDQAATVLDICSRSIAILIGLIRKLRSRHARSKPPYQSRGGLEQNLS